MKTIITVILVSSILFLAGCKGEKNELVPKTSDTSENTTIKNNPEKVLSNKALKQQGSYTKLFNRERYDCGFISLEIIAASLQVNANKIKPGDNECTYFLKEENGKSTRFYFTAESWSNKQVLKEINSAKENAKMFGEDSKLSQYRISETGDTFLSMHQNRMVRILNEANDTAIILIYSPEIAIDETDLDKKTILKDEARERAYAIANYLLNINQTK